MVNDMVRSCYDLRVTMRKIKRSIILSITIVINNLIFNYNVIKLGSSVTMNFKFPKVVYVILLTGKRNFWIFKFIFFHKPYKHVLRNSLVKRCSYLNVFLRYAKHLPLGCSRGWVRVELM